MTSSKCLFVLSILGLPLSVKGFIFIGCYWNDDNNTLSDYYPPVPTTIQCFLQCISANKGYTYAGTQMVPLTCVCGKSIVNQRIQSSIDCNMPCPTMSGDICGGHFRLAVYNITDESIPIIISQKGTTTLPTSPKQADNLDCMCPCSFTSGKWDFLKEINTTKDQLIDILKSDVNELQQNLTIDVKATSAYKNTKRSASDRRTSSMLMGLVGGIIICIPIVLIIWSDIMHILNSLKTKTRPLT
ncbi:uncharacterized protein LOC127737762 [Mytilus californianus]|uniref:uncharacterized protein LOC127737762 n=1 Tax=Mytilus californianus TaxID=6549 RepID=UPI002245AD43|nr:uncharacterized protein LOC127737762 [Mytilus californianus]